MKEIVINNTMIQTAKNRINRVMNNNEKRLNKFGSEINRILIGYIGEEIIKDFLNIKTDQETYEYDIISKGKKIEVKTISCAFKPKPEYLCTVNSHDLKKVHKQNADYYIFLRIKSDFSKGWILGYIKCADFFKKGTYIKKGQDFGKFKFTKANATVLEIKELTKIN
jgi:hypothetical protein